MNKFLRIAVCFVLLGGCVDETADQAETLRIGAVFATPLEEPWVREIHEATEDIKTEFGFEYHYVDSVKQASFEKTLREYAESGYDVIIGDAFAAEEITRRVAREYKHINFCFGSGLGPAEPNFSVFDNWIHEPAYIAGMIAGRITKSNRIGVVGGYPVPEVNRITNAFIEGALEVNPDATFSVVFIDSWFDTAKAKEAALGMIEQGVDVMYAERDGVIEACDERQIPVFGNLVDQSEKSEWTVTSIVWDMRPTIRRLVENVKAGRFAAEDYGEWSWMPKGGSRLAPFSSKWETKLGPEIMRMVQRRTDDIMLGKFRVPIIESKPSER